jgi:hypothetical protein
MKTRHSTVRIGTALMIALLALATVACRKSPDTIGNGLISDSDYIGIYHTDALELVCHSYLDSIGSKNVSNALLGSMNDPVFGLTQAGFCTQLRFSSAGQKFGTDPIVDSLVLQLYLTGYYGDTTCWQTVHAYLLADTLNADTTYYNYTEVALESTDYAEGFQFQPHPRTKTNVVGGDTISQAIVRIPLNNSLGEMLINLDSTAYREPSIFKHFFHGLCLKCDPPAGNGNVSYFNLTNNTYTVMQLYYHNSATPEKAQRYDYYITSADTYFNQFSHDYTQGAPDFVSQLLDGDTALGQQKLYLQTMGGVKTKITFPTLALWTDTLSEGCHIVINEAKLIITGADVDTACFTEPNTLSLVKFNASGSTSILPDYQEGTAYYGGSYNNTKHTAQFRISEYIQELLLGKEDNCGLSLGINGGAYLANRLVINGSETETDNLRVEITYSIVEE